MSDLVCTLIDMQELSVDSLVEQLCKEGVRVEDARLAEDLWGLYDRGRQTIYLQAGMPERYRLAALLHELQHYLRGDRNGHVSQKGENQIDEVVAQLLVDPVEYRIAEAHVRYNVPGIATELDLPQWVIRAYRRLLDRDRRRGAATVSEGAHPTHA